MRKILFLLLLTVSVYGQNPSRFAKIQITGNSNSATATKVNVQETNGEVNTQTINTGFNKNIGLGSTDVVGATTLLNQYVAIPSDWSAQSYVMNSVVFYGGKQWIAKMATVAGDVPAVSSKWEEITFESLANKTITVDAVPTDGSDNAVSSNGVFDALATKAPISSVHNPVTLGTANGLSLATQVLSLGLAGSGSTGALSGTDWNTFNGKFNTPTGLTTNYIPKWNGSSFGNSSVSQDASGNINIEGGSGNDVLFLNKSTGASIGLSGATGYTTKVVLGTSNSTNPDFNIFVGGSIRQTVASSGNTLFGTTTDNGVDKVQVNGSGSFSGNITSIPATASNHVVVKSQLDAFVPSGTVNLTGNQTVQGTKTFNNTTNPTSVSLINGGVSGGILTINNTNTLFAVTGTQSGSSGQLIRFTAATGNNSIFSADGNVGNTGNLFSGFNNGTLTFSVTKEGNITANKLIIPNAVNANEAVNKGQLDAVASGGSFTPPSAGGFVYNLCYWTKIGKVVTINVNAVYTAPTAGSTAIGITYPSGLNDANPISSEVRGVGSYGTNTTDIKPCRVVSSSTSQFGLQIGPTTAGTYVVNAIITYITN